MKFTRSVTLASWLSLLATAGAQAATYRATLLHPPSGFVQSVATGISGASQVGWAGLDAPGNKSHALLWNAAIGSVLDLHPLGFDISYAQDVWGNQQVGYATTLGGSNRALLWNGSADSVVDLHPSEFTHSYALGASENHQVGYGRQECDEDPHPLPCGSNHALLWSGSAASAVELTPSGYHDTAALAVSGNTQVGGGIPAAGNPREAHALVWHGSPDRFVDLHPAGFANSFANGVSGDTQVGIGAPVDSSGRSQALMWKGSASSVVHLHPAGFDASFANDVAGNTQIGYGLGGATGGRPHALAWNGSAESVVDLHAFLADLPVTLIESHALDINVNEAIVGYALDINGIDHAILWTPVPEPSSIALLPGAMLCAPLLRRNRPYLPSSLIPRAFAPRRNLSSSVASGSRRRPASSRYTAS